MSTGSFRYIVQSILLFFAIHYPLSTVHYPLAAAEIRFKSEPIHCTKTLMSLGDVAEIVPNNGENVERLRQTIFCKAPAAGSEHIFSNVEIRTMLSQLGIGSMKHTVGGATTITLVGVDSDSPIALSSVNSSAKDVTLQLVKTLEKQLGDALAVYLDRCVTKTNGRDVELPWSISLKLNHDQAYGLATGGQIEEIEGGTAPFTGTQQFQIHMKNTNNNTGRKIVVAVDADVKLAQRVVVAKRTLPRGYIISENDVELQKIENVKGENFLVDLSEVIGMETTGVVRELSILNAGMFRQPTLVKKGDIVTVRSMMNGIIVRLNGKALDDGVKGETILIESMDGSTGYNRTRRVKDQAPTFSAKVTEPGTVEVYASTTKI